MKDKDLIRIWLSVLRVIVVVGAVWFVLTVVNAGSPWWSLALLSVHACLFVTISRLIKTVKG